METEYENFHSLKFHSPMWYMIVKHLKRKFDQKLHLFQQKISPRGQMFFLRQLRETPKTYSAPSIRIDDIKSLEAAKKKIEELHRINGAYLKAMWKNMAKYQRVTE